MVLKFVMKYPILIGGAIMFILAITSTESKNFFNSYADRFKPNVCKDAMERAKKNGPKEWEISCENQKLTIIKNFKNEGLKEEEINKASYRDVANDLVLLGKVSNTDTLELVKEVTYKLKINKKIIEAFTTGEAITKLAGLTDPKAIAFFIHTNVKVKETFE